MSENRDERSAIVARRASVDMVRVLVGYVHALKEIRRSLHELLHESQETNTLRLLPAILRGEQFRQCSLFSTLDYRSPSPVTETPPACGRRKSIDSMLLQLIFSREAQHASMIVSYFIFKTV